MPPKKARETDRTTELLEKLLVMQMHGMGATQDQIARAVGKQKAWVNALVRGLPRKAE
jgi:hypothetical protein